MRLSLLVVTWRRVQGETSAVTPPPPQGSWDRLAAAVQDQRCWPIDGFMSCPACASDGADVLPEGAE